MHLHTYLANLNGLMWSLTENEVATGELVARRDARRKYQEVPIRYSNGEILLLFELGTLYVQGFRNAGKELFVFKDVTYDVMPAKKYTLGTDYKDFGLDRQIAFTLTLAELDDALGTLRSTNTETALNSLKRPMWQCAVGLAEALRFQDVAMAVMHGTTVPSLDWSRRTKDGDYKVRVKHR